MLDNKSTDFKTLVLLRITKKLIENTASYGIYRLEQILKEKEEEKLKEIEENRPRTKEEIKEGIQKEVREKLSEDRYSLIPSRKIKEDVMIAAGSERAMPSRRAPSPPRPPQRRPPQARMPQRRMPQRRMPQRAPEASGELPEHLRYLQPTRETTTQQVPLDIGKLTPFLQDQKVRTIETAGENEGVFVTGPMGKKPTGIKLTKEEIDQIITTFSQQAKIPKSEGLFKVTLGNIQFTAMVSDTVSSRFIIKKI